MQVQSIIRVLAVAALAAASVAHAAISLDESIPIVDCQNGKLRSKDGTRCLLDNGQTSSIAAPAQTLTTGLTTSTNSTTNQPGLTTIAALPTNKSSTAGSTPKNAETAIGLASYSPDHDAVGGQNKVSPMYSGFVREPRLPTSSYETGSNSGLLNLKAVTKELLSPGDDRDLPQEGVSAAGATPKGYTLIFNDEFNQQHLDTNRWVAVEESYKHGNITNTLQLFENNAQTVSFEDSKLKLSAAKGDDSSNSWEAGKITSQGLFSFQYGRVVVRMKADLSKGFSSAVWMFPNNTGFRPPSAEIDVTQITGRLVNTTFAGFDYNSTPDQQTAYSVRAPFDSTEDDFHIYEMDWDQTSITWHVDGKFMSSHQIPSALACATNSTCLSPFNTSFHLVLNVAVGGDFAGLPDEGSSESTMEVDYIRVYQKVADAKSTYTGMTDDSVYSSDIQGSASGGIDTFINQMNAGDTTQNGTNSGADGSGSQTGGITIGQSPLQPSVGGSLPADEANNGVQPVKPCLFSIETSASGEISEEFDLEIIDNGITDGAEKVDNDEACCRLCRNVNGCNAFSWTSNASEEDDNCFLKTRYSAPTISNPNNNNSWTSYGWGEKHPKPSPTSAYQGLQRK